VIGDSLGNLLLVLIIIIRVFITCVLWKREKALKIMSHGTLNCVQTSSTYSCLLNLDNDHVWFDGDGLRRRKFMGFLKKIRKAFLKLKAFF
jgi:hypothetical protein